MRTVEYGMVYENPIDRADKVAMLAAWNLCFARARWHAKSNNITITHGPYLHVNTLSPKNDQWWYRPNDADLVTFAWSYKGEVNEDINHGV